MGVICPNVDTCKLFSTKGFIENESQRNEYINTWCNAGEHKWSHCARYVTRKALNFCPDFVLPDTDLTPDEVIDKFDSLNEL
jgi:hypothetical protein